MKFLRNSILVISAFGCGVSCQMIDVDQHDENVKILVGISDEEQTRVSEDGSRFTDGDQIKVHNTSRTTSNLAAFVYNESQDDWSTSDAILWEGQGVNRFQAWHPASASYGSFTVPQDQTSGLGSSDWMTAQTDASSSEGGVMLSFRRHLSKVKVRITGWGSEYPAGSRTVNRLYVRSLSGVLSNNGSSVAGNGSSVLVNTYVLNADKEMVAIVAPGTYAAGSEIMQIYVNGNSQPLAVKVSKALEFKSGKAYDLELSVGRDFIELAPDAVSVVDWDDESLDDQEMVVEPDADTDNVEFNENHCIYYRTNLTGGWDKNYENYRAQSSYIYASAGGAVVEMKFKMAAAGSYNNYYLAASSNRAKDYYDAFYFTSSRLSLIVDVSDDEWYSYGWTWAELGISQTDLITLRFSGIDETLTINGKVLSCEGLKSMAWTYLFSSYYREYDEGEWKDYDTVPDGSALYYVKMYDKNGNLTYLGHAAKAVNPSTSKMEYCWYSNKNGTIEYQFANDSANQGGYTGNF